MKDVVFPLRLVWPVQEEVVGVSEGEVWDRREQGLENHRRSQCATVERGKRVYPSRSVLWRSHCVNECDTPQSSGKSRVRLCVPGPLRIAPKSALPSDSERLDTLPSNCPGYGSASFEILFNVQSSILLLTYSKYERSPPRLNPVHPGQVGEEKAFCRDPTNFEALGSNHPALPVGLGIFLMRRSPPVALAVLNRSPHLLLTNLALAEGGQNRNPSPSPLSFGTATRSGPVPHAKHATCSIEAY